MASRGMPAAIMAWMIRHGVHGSSLPGLSTMGIFSGSDGKAPYRSTASQVNALLKRVDDDGNDPLRS